MSKNTIQELVELANTLDLIGLTKLADSVDATAKTISNIKTAQYLGIQGYWIRNRRCWENCYRQKRATNKAMAAQEVWVECQKEYEKSINDDYSGWEKYADEDADFIKTASDSKVKPYIKLAKNNLNKSVQIKVANGEELPVAIFKTIDNNIEKYNNGLLDCADKLADIAVELDKNGYTGLSAHIATINSELIKEAGIGDFFRGIGNMGKGIANWSRAGSVRNQTNAILQALNSTMQEIQANPNSAKQGISNFLQSTQQPLTQISQTISKISDPAKKTNQQQLLKSLETSLQTLGKNPTAEALNQAGSVMRQSLSGIAQSDVQGSVSQSIPVENFQKQISDYMINNAGYDPQVAAKMATEMARNPQLTKLLNDGNMQAAQAMAMKIISQNPPKEQKQKSNKVKLKDLPGVISKLKTLDPADIAQIVQALSAPTPAAAAPVAAATPAPAAPAATAAAPVEQTLGV